MKFKRIEPTELGFTELAYVNVSEGLGCSSHVGYNGGEVRMSLNSQVCQRELMKHSNIHYNELSTGMRRRTDSTRVFACIRVKFATF